MFLHIENQTLLWNSLQKSPYIVEFQQKYAAHRESWFRGIVEQFYTQWIGAGRPIPTAAKDLLEMNKHALKLMVSDLKRLLGYSASASSNNGSASAPLASYDMGFEKKQREDKWSSEFSQYQEEYNRILASPALPRNVLPSEMTDERITNMDELLAEHAKRREYDLSSIAAGFPQLPLQPPQLPLQPQPANDSNPVVASQSHPRLKILEEIASTKSVTWSEQLESVGIEPTSSPVYEYSV